MDTCWVEESPLAAIVHVQGDIDLFTAAEFRECVHTTAENTAHNGYVVVDLSELEYIDGSGLRVLEESRQMCRQRNRELVLVAPPPHIERILEIVKLGDRLPVLNSVEELFLREQSNGDHPHKDGEET